MKKIIYLIILILPFYIFSKPIQFNEINKIMDRIFEYHIEYKEYDTKLISRALGLYIDQFDPLKIYLLQEEVDEYINLNQKNANIILNQIKNGDFSVFENLNKIFQKSITRSRKLREEIRKELIKTEIVHQNLKNDDSSYAKNFNELVQRQKNTLSVFYLNQQKRSKIDTQEKRERVFVLLERKLNKNETNYLEYINENIISQYILKSFSRSLDAHSYFFSEDEAEQMRLSLEKEFEGVGIVLSESIDGVIVTDLIANSPAQRAKIIKTNDILTEINGESVEYLNFDKVMKMMKTKDNPDIVLGFKRVLDDGSISFWRIKLQREPISMDDQRLTYTLEPYADGVIAKLDLTSFYENSNGITSEKDMKKAIRTIKKEDNLLGIVLDLRENAGGFLSQAIKVSSLFIKSGVVVISKNSQDEMRYLRNIEGDAYYNGPLVILTSKLSASASEIVAASLQDYGVALIVGDKATFGKGSIQYQTITDKNAEHFFKVTVGKYYTVSGKTTQIEGVKADIIVPSEYSPFKIGEKYLKYPLKSDRIKEAYTDRLSDIQGKIKIWFRVNYLPNLQKKVTFWQKMLPTLKANSQNRILKDPDFQNFLKRQKQIKAKLQGEDVQIDASNYGQDDLQMIEATNVLKDMIFIESDMRKVQGL
ncbi:MAG: Tail-specific protease [Candidatus Anoxychlamydiales bacterium]|nr:Tail-specific protease [Candidatus Anoxychlamydiales bacterium]